MPLDSSTPSLDVGEAYPTGAYWEIDWYLRGRLIQHLQRRSQRPFRPPEGVSWYQHLERLGLAPLSELAHA